MPSRVTGWLGLIVSCCDAPPGRSVVVSCAEKLRGAPNCAPPTLSSKVASIEFMVMVNGGRFSGLVRGPGRNVS